MTPYLAGASLLFNGLQYSRLRRSIKAWRRAECHRAEDLTKHFLVVDLPSAGLALSGALAQQRGYADAEQIAAFLSGVAGMVAFRPTAANLKHEH